MGQAIKSRADLDDLFDGLVDAQAKSTGPSRGDMESGKASWMHWRLVNIISEFEDELTDAQELAIEFIGRASSDLFYLETIAFWNPDMMVLMGTDPQGVPQRYMHHTSEMGYLLVAAPKTQGKARRVSEALKASLING